MAIFAGDHSSESVKVRNSPIARSYSIGAWLKRRAVIYHAHSRGATACVVLNIQQRIIFWSTCTMSS